MGIYTKTDVSFAVGGATGGEEAAALGAPPIESGPTGADYLEDTTEVNIEDVIVKGTEKC